MSDLVLNFETVLDRLHSSMSCEQQEEGLHPWQVQGTESFKCPLLRMHINPPGVGMNMRSMAPTRRLGRRWRRVGSLYNLATNPELIRDKHLNCPYLSFTCNPANISALGNTFPEMSWTLTVIDPDTRVRNRLPTLHFKTEAEEYCPEVAHTINPDEYLCLWEVTTAEVVGHWDWDILKNDKFWYENTVRPTYWQFLEKASTPAPNVIQPSTTAQSSGNGTISLLESPAGVQGNVHRARLARTVLKILATSEAATASTAQPSKAGPSSTRQPSPFSASSGKRARGATNMYSGASDEEPLLGGPYASTDGAPDGEEVDGFCIVDNHEDHDSEPDGGEWVHEFVGVRSFV
ncbi:hypothetical protein F4802DRAFT_619741 [Xylaria palmicola]|nr:hypothetical protein F4802DRAFT_619741 [Xylaria palmicola]